MVRLFGPLRIIRREVSVSESFARRP